MIFKLILCRLLGREISQPSSNNERSKAYSFQTPHSADNFPPEHIYKRCTQVLMCCAHNLFRIFRSRFLVD